MMSYSKPYVLDENERKIVEELVKDPRLSDNSVSRLTGIPVKTVNRKRKILEDKGYLHYFAYMDNFAGTKQFNSRQMFTITFRHGITRHKFLLGLKKAKEKYSSNPLFSKHVLESHLGEQNGRLLLIVVLESFSKNDLIEIFNADIVSMIEEQYGLGAIYKTEVVDLTIHLNLLHNYSFFDKDNDLKKDDIFLPNSIFVSE